VLTGKIVGTSENVCFIFNAIGIRLAL